MNKEIVLTKPFKKTVTYTVPIHMDVKLIIDEENNNIDVYIKYPLYTKYKNWTLLPPSYSTEYPVDEILKNVEAETLLIFG